MWHVIGLGGATCSGKTTLARRLEKEFPDTVVITQDKHFLSPDSPKHILIEELNHANWELVSSVDMESLMEEVQTCLKQEPRSGQGLLVIEGIVILNYRPIAELCQQKFFVTLSKEVCWERRQLRDYDPPDPPGYFEKCVWPMHKMHLEEVKKLYPDTVFIDGSAVKKSELFLEIYDRIMPKMNTLV